jgi:hypothetical protein
VLQAELSVSPPKEKRDPRRVQIVELYGTQWLRVNQQENFRVRLAPGASWPIQYLWDMGDGTQSAGNNIVHKYSRVGTYQVIVTARNSRGVDRDTLNVVVTESEPERLASASRTGGSSGNTRSSTSAARPSTGTERVSWEARVNGSLYGAKRIDQSLGGYTWVVGTHLDRFKAEELAKKYWEEGYRSGLVIDKSGAGSPAFRVVIGQFPTEADAIFAQRKLTDFEGRMWLLHLDELLNN